MATDDKQSSLRSYSLRLDEADPHHLFAARPIAFARDFDLTSWTCLCRSHVRSPLPQAGIVLISATRSNVAAIATREPRPKKR